MKFIENFIDTEINLNIGGYEICVQKNIDGWFILSSNERLMNVYYLLSKFDGSRTFLDCYVCNNDYLSPVLDLDYLCEIFQELDIEDDEETTIYNLEKIVNFIEEYFEN